MKKLFISLTVYLFFLLTSVNAWATPFTSLYAFGDSLSDGGDSSTAMTSIYKLLGNNCDPTHPCPPYVKGHYSNGSVAVEYLADKILPGGANPANFFNFSVGGATSGIGNFGDGGSATDSGALGLPGISTIVNSYAKLADPNLADPNALYFIWGGANDLLTGGSPVDAAANIVANVNTLIGAGATHFFIPNLPDLGLTPFANAAGMADDASLFSTIFNTALASQLTALGMGNSGIDLMQFDTYSFFNNLVAGPGNYGFANIHDSCLTFTATGFISCSNPNEYVFWDDFHPTTQAHLVLANAFARALPLPDVPALLFIGGLALLYSRMHRKNRYSIALSDANIIRTA